MKPYFVLFLLILASALRAQDNVPSAKPNIIFIVADDLGYYDLGCYGNPYIQTPNLDRLSRQGALFTHAYAAAPVCSPSRAALLTGKNPVTTGITQYLEGTRGDTTSTLRPAAFEKHLRTGSKTIATYLQHAHYTTAMIGKWHLGYQAEDQPGKFGFDYERVPANKIFYYDFTLTQNNKVVYSSKADENLTDVLTLEAVKFIKENRSKPFFLYLAHFAPHLLLQPKPQKLPRYYFTYQSLSNGRFDPAYAATVETLDDGIGVLIETLTALGLLENTLLIFTSDNGGLSTREFGIKPTDNAPLRKGKGHLYEGGLRVPLLMVYKGQITPGTVIHAPVEHVDLSHTIVRMAAPMAKWDGHGKDLRGLWSNGFLNPRPFIWHYPHFSNQGGRPCSAILFEQYKLIHFYEGDTLELYNLQDDPGETRNLAATMPDKASALKEMLQNWLQKNDAKFPSKR